MKKVRFESPVKSYKIFEMHDECHFPRPFIERQVNVEPRLPQCENTRLVPFTVDPVESYEYCNSSPYPIASKTLLSGTEKIDNKWTPSNELDLSILDSSKPRVLTNNGLYSPQSNHCNYSRQPLSARESNSRSNCLEKPNLVTNSLKKNDNFFLRRDNMNLMHMTDRLSSQFNKLALDKENNPLSKKMEIMKRSTVETPKYINDMQHRYDCKNNAGNNFNVSHNTAVLTSVQNSEHCLNKVQCHCASQIPQCLPRRCTFRQEICAEQCYNSTELSPVPSQQNIVDKKKWAMETFQQKPNDNCMEVTKVTGNKKEPTVSDLFKIIKLQNEQLKLLQEKVDKLISDQEVRPVTNCITEHVALESVCDKNMSIGVMTSFEMVRTSTIINEKVTKNEAQIQCNRSQISIKEVVASQPVQVNFLDGIQVTRNEKAPAIQENNCDNTQNNNRDVTKTTNVPDDKTFNEQSLYNVRVDNATTPLMSPEQSLYLDVRDYSDSDDGSNDGSNVGWTYYNKVMNHVNGMLHESDMPSSASALYRNTRQKCLQMQFDKTNISVAKRVTFGDDLLGMQQQKPNLPSTDTSLKMNQLAAKYLKSNPVKSPSPRPAQDMSYATRNYMEKHKLLQGTQMAQKAEIPKFLDITALKQQPKLL